MSIVKNNMLTRLNYTPYCPNPVSRFERGGCDNPRTVFTGSQMRCPKCGWESSFENAFIQEYIEAQKILTDNVTRKRLTNP